MNRSPASLLAIISRAVRLREIFPTKYDASILFAKDRLGFIGYLISWQMATKIRNIGALSLSKLFPIFAIALVLDVKLVDMFKLIPYDFGGFVVFNNPTNRLLALFWGTFSLFIASIIYAQRCPSINKIQGISSAIDYYKRTPTMSGVEYIVERFEEYIGGEIVVISQRILEGRSYAGDSIFIPISVHDCAKIAIEKIYYSIEKLKEARRGHLSLIIDDAYSFDEGIRFVYLLESYSIPVSRLSFFVLVAFGWILIGINTYEIVVRVLVLTVRHLAA